MNGMGEIVVPYFVEDTCVVRRLKEKKRRDCSSAKMNSELSVEPFLFFSSQQAFFDKINKYRILFTRLTEIVP